MSSIVAIGMTFVLLTAGVDLSVGAIMFLSAAVAGKLALAGWPLPVTLLAIVVTGLLFGAVNATPRLVVVPGVAITVLTLAFNAVADALRDAMARQEIGRVGGRA